MSMSACTLSDVEFNNFKIEAEATIDVSNLSGYNDSYFSDNIDILKKYGWTYSNGCISYVVDFPNTTIIDKDGEKYLSNEESVIQVPKSNSESISQIHIELENATITLYSQDGKYVISMDDFLDAMDGKCCHKSSSPETKSMQEPPRCIDYNGPLGDNENYETGAQRIINYIGSDCNLANLQGLCLGEHSNGKGGCYNTHGGKLCTELINN